MASESDFSTQRELMVRTQLANRDIWDVRVLDAFRRVPRERFVPTALMARAYEDRPLSIGSCQTISQPYIVALMTQLLELSGSERVLEIGTGSGYQTAILAELASQVYTIEVIPSLATSAQERLASLGYTNIQFRTDDGADGWEAHAPFDGILVTAAPRRFPESLGRQLCIGACAIAPIGDYVQDLRRIRRVAAGLEAESIVGVRFVPMVGKAQEV